MSATDRNQHWEFSLPRATPNLLGQRFGRLSVIKRATSGTRGQTRWSCRCDCGKITIVYGFNLLKDNSKSCGCLHREIDRSFHLRHGDADQRNRKVASEYRTWCGMIQRCENPNNPAYERYGGRGIAICRRW